MTAEEQRGQEIRAALMILVTTPFLRQNSRKTDHPPRQASDLTHTPLHVFPTGPVQGGDFTFMPTGWSKIRLEENCVDGKGVGGTKERKREFRMCKDG